MTKETTTITTENKNERIILKTPGPPHSVQSGTSSSGTNSGGNNNISNGGSQQKQSPTVNIYVNVLSKNQDKGDRLVCVDILNSLYTYNIYVYYKRDIKRDNMKRFACI